MRNFKTFNEEATFVAIITKRLFYPETNGVFGLTKSNKFFMIPYVASKKIHKQKVWCAFYSYDGKILIPTETSKIGRTVRVEWACVEEFTRLCDKAWAEFTERHGEHPSEEVIKYYEQFL